MPRHVRAHPAEIEILALVLGRDGEGPAEARGHVEACPTCTHRRDALRRLADAVALEDGLRDALATAEILPPSPGAAERRERIATLAGAADDAQRDADEILEFARDERPDLPERVGALATRRGGRLALLYACQRGAAAAALPQRALALAAAIESVADARGHEDDVDTLTVPAALLRAEARLLSSQALLNIGRLEEAREAAAVARREFASMRGDPFSEALCDYFEASVLCFQGEFATAGRLLEKAARVFADFAQDHWVGRAEAMRGVMLLQRGNHTRALAAFETAVSNLDPERDGNAFAVALLSRARCLGLLSRFEAARQGFAQALQVARRHRLDALVFGVRQNLADLEMLRGHFEKALASWKAVADEADRLGLEEDRVVTRLAAAECLGRLGRTAEMIAALREVGRLVAVTDFRGNPAWSEVAARLDPGDVDLGVISEVRAHLEGARDGFVLPFRVARRA